MSIYTKTGDKGTTALFGGKRVPKYDDTVEAYGSIDELTSFIGLALSKIKNDNDKKFLTDIQLALYQIMSVLAGYKMSLEKVEKAVEDFEKYIDKTEENLPKLHYFIIPQGGETASLFQVIRTIARKVERLVVKLFADKKESDSPNAIIIMKYINRLSDLFFIMARKYTQENEIILAKGDIKKE